MNQSLLVLAALVVVPVLILMALRINAALVFLSLCLGDVLVQFVSTDASSILPAMGMHVSMQTVKLILLGIPVLLTAIFMIRSVKGARLMINVLPALGVGLVGAFLIIPELPPHLAASIVDSSQWQKIKNAQDMIVGASALLSLLVLWLQRPKSGEEGKHAKKHAHA
ncbi:MAG TPA: hypothetical protein VFN56_02330 [Candidatus Saccharimonadales bacterium]|nr:hypothetical protein [Candidatus Saccharimonadales bacterium]